MGAWGTGLLENDVAADVAATFRDVLDDGGSVEEAVAAVMDEWQGALDDMDDGPDIILTLAWLTSAHNQVPAEIKQEALTIINTGQTLDRWRDPADVELRRAEERRLADLLEGRLLHPESQEQPS
jgi:hypothetical protein